MCKKKIGPFLILFIKKIWSYVSAQTMYLRYAIIMVSLVAQLVKICLQCRRPWFDSWIGKIPCRRKWQPPVLFFIRKPWLLLISFFKSRLHGNLKQHRLTRLRELVKRVCTNVVSDCTLVEMRLLHPKEEMRPFEVQSSWIDNLLHSMIKTTEYKSPSP